MKKTKVMMFLVEPDPSDSPGVDSDPDDALLRLAEPPPLVGDVDPRVAHVYQLAWEHREDVLARLYEPDRIYIGRALHRLLLELSPDSRFTASSLLEAAKDRFFRHLQSRWSRIRVEEIPTGDGRSQTVVKSLDPLLTGVLREMRQRGLLAEIEG